ncbi:MAG: hypothetical protein HY885_02710 [Deltaproteobacteria bacterium]|nr:hypothetical protein [Deltaproteobacteria bacterium]
MKIDKQPTVGDDIDSRCLKCKDVTNHTIVALVGDQVARVQCNVCKGTHNFRPVKIEKKPTVRRQSAGRTVAGKNGLTSRVMKAEAHFRELIGGRDPLAAVSYAMTANFKDGDLVDHPVFGLGIITRKVPPNKIEVTFKEGSKVLICAPAEHK